MDNPYPLENPDPELEEWEINELLEITDEEIKEMIQKVEEGFKKMALSMSFGLLFDSKGSDE